MLVGDAAVALLKAGADASKRDNDGMLAIDLAPDKEVRTSRDPWPDMVLTGPENRSVDLSNVKPNKRVLRFSSS